MSAKKVRLYIVMKNIQDIDNSTIKTHVDRVYTTRTGALRRIMKFSEKDQERCWVHEAKLTGSAFMAFGIMDSNLAYLYLGE